MALTRLIASLVLLSLIVVSSTSPNDDSNTKNPGTSNVSPFEHSQYNGGQLVHELHEHVLHGYKVHGDDYFQKEGYTFPIPKENPEYNHVSKYEEPEVPEYGMEKKTYDYQLHEGMFPNIHAIAVEGLILCKSGSAFTPIQRRAIIKCQSSYASGYNNGYYVTSSETNEKGCFVAMLLMEKLVEHSINLKKCKAYPEYSPKETCNVVAPNSESYLSPSRNEGDTSYYNAGSLVYTEEPLHFTNQNELAMPEEKPSVPHY